jgi:hypothetical protein
MPAFAATSGSLRRYTFTDAMILLDFYFYFYFYFSGSSPMAAEKRKVYVKAALAAST